MFPGKAIIYAKNKFREYSGEDSQCRHLRGFCYCKSSVHRVFVSGCSRAKANRDILMIFFFFFFSTEHSTVSEIKVNSSAINLCHNSSRSLCLSTKQEA